MSLWRETFFAYSSVSWKVRSCPSVCGWSSVEVGGPTTRAATCNKRVRSAFEGGISFSLCVYDAYSPWRCMESEIILLFWRCRSWKAYATVFLCFFWRKNNIFFDFQKKECFSSNLWESRILGQYEGGSLSSSSRSSHLVTIAWWHTTSNGDKRRQDLEVPGPSPRDLHTHPHNCILLVAVVKYSSHR